MMHVLHEPEISMLRSEVEMLMSERQKLLRLAGAAAVFVNNLDMKRLPAESYEAAEMLSVCINGLSEDTLQDALERVHAEPVDE